MNEDKPSQQLETFTGADGTVVRFNPAVCQVVEAASYDGPIDGFVAWCRSLDASLAMSYRRADRGITAVTAAGTAAEPRHKR